jgi:FAD dependent oxidoreductase TIGR03364
MQLPRETTLKSYDLAVVGSGIVGLGSALAAARAGKRVVVVERDAACIGASIRNFGFVTVSGQRRGVHWQRARRSRDVWAEVAPKAGIEVVHRGTTILARRPEAVAVAEAFLRTEMGGGCRLLGADEATTMAPALRCGEEAEILYSPHELRVESRTAIPKLAAWLTAEMGVDFYWSTAVREIAVPRIVTSRGELRADAVIVCPGHDRSTLYADRISPAGLSVCTLQMLRVRPAGAVALHTAVMSDLSLGRYEGFADLPEAAALKARLAGEEAEALAAGVHLIVVRSADGSLVVGDSHVYGDAPAPFASDRFDALILAEMDKVLDLGAWSVAERWTGNYVSSRTDVVWTDAPERNVRIAMVTGGTGASTGFALGEEMVASLGW